MGDDARVSGSATAQAPPSIVVAKPGITATLQRVDEAAGKDTSTTGR